MAWPSDEEPEARATPLSAHEAIELHVSYALLEGGALGDCRRDRAQVNRSGGGGLFGSVAVRIAGVGCITCSTAGLDLRLRRIGTDNQTAKAAPDGSSSGSVGRVHPTFD